MRYAETGQIVQSYSHVGDLSSSVLLYSEMSTLNNIVLHMFQVFSERINK